MTFFHSFAVLLSLLVENKNLVKFSFSLTDRLNFFRNCLPVLDLPAGLIRVKLPAYVILSYQLFIVNS